MKWISIAVIIVLVLSLVGMTYYLVQQSASVQRFTTQLSESQQKVTSLEKDNSGLASEKTALQADINSLDQEKKLLSDQITKLEGEEKDLNSQVTDLTKKLKDKTSSEAQLMVDKGALQRKLMCEDTLGNVDFSSNESVSASLANYVDRTKNTDLPVSAHYWNLVWTDSKYSIHTVEVHSAKEHMNYIWKFTVYFQGESYGHHKYGVFYNDDQCWLYLAD